MGALLLPTPYEPRPGDYGVISTGTIFSFPIRLGTFSMDDHAIIYIGDGKCIESIPSKGVHIGNISAYKNIAWNRHEDLTDLQRLLIVAKAHAYVGLEYNFADIALLAFRQLGMNILEPFVSKQASSTKAFICSELVAECYREAGVPLFDKPDYTVTPANLGRRLEFL